MSDWKRVIFAREREYDQVLGQESRSGSHPENDHNHSQKSLAIFDQMFKKDTLQNQNAQNICKRHRKAPKYKQAQAGTKDTTKDIEKHLKAQTSTYKHEQALTSINTNKQGFSPSRNHSFSIASVGRTPTVMQAFQKF